MKHALSILIGLLSLWLVPSAEALVFAAESDPIAVDARNEFEVWLDLGGRQGETAGTLAAPDGDGISNLVKYAFGLTAGLPDHRVLASDGTSGLPRVALLEEGAAGDKVLTVTYVRRKNDTRLVYQAEFSTDLGQWEPAARDEAVVILDANWERVTSRDPEAAARVTRFVRVRVDYSP